MDSCSSDMFNCEIAVVYWICHVTGYWAVAPSLFCCSELWVLHACAWIVCIWPCNLLTECRLMHSLKCSAQWHHDRCHSPLCPSVLRLTSISCYNSAAFAMYCKVPLIIYAQYTGILTIPHAYWPCPVDGWMVLVLLPVLCTLANYPVCTCMHSKR